MAHRGVLMGTDGRIDVTDAQTDEIREYVRGQTDASELHLERRGTRTYLVADGGRLA